MFDRADYEKKLNDIIQSRMLTTYEVMKAIGICHQTLLRFRDGLPLLTKSLRKIRNYVDSITPPQ